MNLDLPLDEWVMATYHHDAYRTRSFFERTGVPYNQRNLVGDVAIWFISQVAWLSDANNILIVDDLLRFEHLAEDWSAFSAKHGIERELVHVNSSARQADAEQHMTQRTRDMISEYYRRTSSDLATNVDRAIRSPNESLGKMNSLSSMPAFRCPDWVSGEDGPASMARSA